MRRDCSDCIHSTAGEYSKCRHPKNLRADLFGEYPVYTLCASHREVEVDDPELKSPICGKSGRWFENGD